MKKFLILTFFITLFSSQEVYDQIIKEQKNYVSRLERMINFGKVTIENLPQFFSNLDRIFDSTLQKNKIDIDNYFITKNKKLTFRVSAIDLLIKKLKNYFLESQNLELKAALLKQKAIADEERDKLMRHYFIDQFCHLSDLPRNNPLSS